MGHLLRASRLVKVHICRHTIKLCAHTKTSSPRIEEVGKLENPRIGTKYTAGQLFLHKVFGYRGVVVFPWEARVYDRNLRTKAQSYGCTHHFYQALIDSRDRPHINIHKSQIEANTFLGDIEKIILHGDKSILYDFDGIDYVAHDDILPYTSTGKRPIQHELFDKFLFYLPTERKASVSRGNDTLKEWQEMLCPWLKLTEVDKETTKNIKVTVIPFYRGTRDSRIFWWRYCVRIENLGERAVQLRKANWWIFSLNGKFDNVKETGVVGLEPCLDKSSPAFQYSSHVSLESPRGLMWGTFRMEQDGYFFDCVIPGFFLRSRESDEELM